METVRLRPSIIRQNCSKISWSCPALSFSNDIQRIISKHDGVRIDCGKHNYMFILLPNNPPAIPFTFPETNMLMQLIPHESDIFYLKAALREYVNTFEVVNSKSEPVSPEDIV